LDEEGKVYTLKFQRYLKPGRIGTLRDFPGHDMQGLPQGDTSHTRRTHMASGLYTPQNLRANLGHSAYITRAIRNMAFHRHLTEVDHTGDRQHLWATHTEKKRRKEYSFAPHVCSATKRSSRYPPRDK